MELDRLEVNLIVAVMSQAIKVLEQACKKMPLEHVGQAGRSIGSLSYWRDYLSENA